MHDLDRFDDAIEDYSVCEKHGPFAEEDGCHSCMYPTGTFYVEVTDSSGDRPNYCWIRRYYFDAPLDISDRAMVRRGKALAGYSGVRCRRSDYGDCVRLDVVGARVVLFIGYDDSAEY